MMEKKILLNTIVFTIVVLQSLLFIPEHILKDYNIIGYSIILGLFIMMNTLTISKDQNIYHILRDSSIYLTVLIPLALLLYVNIQYKNTISKDANKVGNYNILKVISTLLFLLQTYGIYTYIFDGKTTNTLLGLFITSLINIFVSGLLWSQLKFFVTDGFTSNIIAT
jgi:hypothetical protein